MNKLITNLCIIHQHSKILLGMKKRRFGAGKWNGYGGKVLPGESIEECLLREVEEEAGIKLEEFHKLGLMEFEFQKTGEIIEVHLYKARKFSGTPVETEEMRPQWFTVEEIPFKEMWPDDIYWMPLFLADKKFKGRFVFGEGDIILSKELEEVKDL